MNNDKMSKYSIGRLVLEMLEGADSFKAKRVSVDVSAARRFAASPAPARGNVFERTGMRAPAKRLLDSGEVSVSVVGETNVFKLGKHGFIADSVEAWQTWLADRMFWACSPENVASLKAELILLADEELSDAKEAMYRRAIIGGAKLGDEGCIAICENREWEF